MRAVLLGLGVCLGGAWALSFGQPATALLADAIDSANVFEERDERWLYVAAYLP